MCMLYTVHPPPLHPAASVSIRQHPSASISIRQHTSAYVSKRQHTSAYVNVLSTLAPAPPRTSNIKHTSASVSLRQHALTYVPWHPPRHVPTLVRRSLYIAYTYVNACRRMQTYAIYTSPRSRPPLPIYSIRHLAYSIRHLYI